MSANASQPIGKHDAHDGHCCDGRINGVSALTKHVEAGLGSKRLAGGHHAVTAKNSLSIGGKL